MLVKSFVVFAFCIQTAFVTWTGITMFGDDSRLYYCLVGGLLSGFPYGVLVAHWKQL